METTQFCCLITIVLSWAATNHAAKWSYTGKSGPLYWHEIFPDDCSGKYQSPIDIRPEETIYNPELKNFAIWYDPPKPDSKMYITNNGHTVQVELEGDFFVTNGGLSHVYKAVQFHFHWGHTAQHGSEHTIDNKPSPIELHLVTYNHDLYSGIGQAVTEKGGLAVLGVMYEISEEDNPTLASIIEALINVRDPEKRKAEIRLLSLRDLLPDDITRYYRYNGSLTTPGCFESVTWTVFDNKQTISHKQLKEFTTILQHKHKHSKGKKADGSRHRRSMSKAQREKESKADDVLVELGIRGNEFEETILKSELLHEKMMADMSQEDSILTILESLPTPKPKSTLDEERAGKIDQSIDDQTGVHGHTKQKAENHHSKHVEEVAEDEEEIYIQETIVNNFRHVQPLNERTVYRSFKLKDTIIIEEDEPKLLHQTDRFSRQHNNANHCRMSTTAVVAVFVLYLLFI